MNDKMSTAQYPEFLKGDTFSFKIKEVLKDSLYYPGSGTDGEMVRYFRGNFHSFVHVDYGVTKEQFEFELANRPFTGFNLIFRQSLDPELLIPEVDHQLQKRCFNRTLQPYCEWMIFENQNKERFSLLNISAEGVESYCELYVRHGIEAKAFPCVRTDGFSGNWTNFTSGPHLQRVVTHSRTDKPQYLIAYLEHNWANYSNLMEQYYGFTVWEYEGSRESTRSFDFRREYYEDRINRRVSRP